VSASTVLTGCFTAEDETMDSIEYRQNIKGSVEPNRNREKCWQYNWEHVVFVTKKRKRNFRKEYNREVTRLGIEEAASMYKIGIKELSFGDDYAHVHLYLTIPNTITVAQAVQILKSHSASVIFQKLPGFRKLYPRGSFWGYQYSNSSFGPVGEDKIRNYIKRQDVSRVTNQRKLFN
jgi:REP element-mobilizing transposase RayT